MIIKAKYDTACRFFNGYAEVREGTQNSLIDKTGKAIFSGDFDIGSPAGTLATIVKKGRFGLADISERTIVLEPIFGSVGICGLAALVRGDRGTSGLYHIKSRNWVLPMQRQDIFFIVDHFVVESSNGREFYALSDDGVLTKILDPTKKPAGQDQHDEAPPKVFQTVRMIKPEDRPFQVTQKDGRSGMIGLNGRILIPFIYDEIKPTGSGRSDSIYIVKKDGKWGITRYDELLLPCKYDEILHYTFNNDGFYLKQGTKHGFYVYSDEQKVHGYVIPCKYERFDDQLYWVQPADVNREEPYQSKPQHPFYFLGVYYDGGKHGFVDLKGHEFFKD